jgi:hypothetical protein
MVPCYPHRVPDASTPICPVCGYDRRGIDFAAKCPECGTDGLDSWIVVVGEQRRSRIMHWLLLVLGGAFLLAAFIGAMTRKRPFDPSDILIIIVLTLPAVIGLMPRFRMPPVWSIHARGISIRHGSVSEFIPRDDIVTIRCTDSLLGAVSVLSIVRRRSSMKGLVGATPYLYLGGPDEVRRARFAELRRTLGIGEVNNPKKSE